MTIIVDDIGADTIEKMQKLLAGIPGGIDKAVKAALSRAAGHLRTNAAKAVRERYDISSANLRGEKNVTIKYSYGSGVTAYVNFSGNKIPLFRYGGASPSNPTPDTSKGKVPVSINGITRMAYPGVPAAGHQLKSTGATRFDNAFVARMKSGHVGIFERTGAATASGSDQIHELMGSSFPQMLGNQEVADKLTEAAYEKFDERLSHEVLRVMNGWGG